MIGTRLAHYEIVRHLGSGGMGDVYQATDSKLGRSVAIKFLPQTFSRDTERVARFQREARVLTKAQSHKESTQGSRMPSRSPSLASAWATYRRSPRDAGNPGPSETCS